MIYRIIGCTILYYWLHCSFLHTLLSVNLCASFELRNAFVFFPAYFSSLFHEPITQVRKFLVHCSGGGALPSLNATFGTNVL